ncbi:hypothetical protein JCM10908_001705 [Rhodotorula pacifica]|uniref:pseudouridine-5'-phosphate glycosidase family protein n=1 Tax=Rhodotorula pacifica TaxID=1495444 RepID=UPI003177456C
MLRCLPLRTARSRIRTFSHHIAVRSWSTTATSTRAPLAGLPIDVAPEVLQAQAEGRPVVALESTLITHGLPPPHSQSLPRECEDILRSQGVTPATIAILNGRIKVGVEGKDLDYLAERGWEARQDKRVAERLWKVGRRELGAAVVKRLDGGTTVSGTMAIAHLAGIKIFSTGGIGGVHRGAETSFDISSDLIALSDTPVAVICAGSKSILDIGLTLEYLEAHAVPVAGFKTSEWPAFYTAQSGYKAPMQLDSAAEVAETILMTDKLGLSSSLLLGNPIPAEYHAVGEELQRAVDQAVAESVENGMARSGKQVTPWLLQRVAELSEGRSLASNKALIKNNVRVGGEIAIEYARMLKEASVASSSSFMPAVTAGSSSGRASTPSAVSSQSSASKPDRVPPPPVQAKVVVAGVLAVDISMLPTSASPLRTTAPGKVALTLGGVAGNVAGATHSILASASPSVGQTDVLLLAPVAEDTLGDVARSGLARRGMRTDGLVAPAQGRTATCGILLDEKGELVGGIADMDIAHQLEGAEIVKHIKRAQPELVCFDGNLSQEAMRQIVADCLESSTSTFFEPTSNQKSLQLLKALEKADRNLITHLPATVPLVTYAAPNIHELAQMYEHASFSEHSLYAAREWFDYYTVSAQDLALRLPKWVLDEGVAQMAIRLLATSLFGTLFVKSGSRGVLVVQRISNVDQSGEWAALPKSKGTAVIRSGLLGDVIVLKHYAALPLKESEIRNVTGAGDNLAGALLAGISRGLMPTLPLDLDRLVELAQRAAVNTLKSDEAVGDHTALSQSALLPRQMSL